jgi:hypothetical protein
VRKNAVGFECRRNRFGRESIWRNRRIHGTQRETALQFMAGATVIFCTIALISPFTEQPLDRAIA